MSIQNKMIELKEKSTYVINNIYTILKEIRNYGNTEF